jgi:chromosome partitioning protein
MGKIIAICNQKGGVGKTTTAISLCSYLAMQGKKVLLVDVDPQANATSGLGIDKTKIALSVYDVILGQRQIEEIILTSKITNLSLIPANSNLIGAEVELVEVEGREFRLQLALSPVRLLYDYIFLDCPPSLGLLTLNALVAADSALIPVQCEYYALEGLTQLLNTINLVKDNLNNNLAIEGALLTMADFRTNLTQEVIGEIRNFFKEKVYQTVIPRNIRLSEAPGFGKPICLYDKHSVGAQKYRALAEEFLGVKPLLQAALAEQAEEVAN